MVSFDKLYKYIIQPSVVESVLRGSLRFTPVRDLNDPSELSPTMDAEAVRESLSRLRREGYSELDMINLRRQGLILQKLAPRFKVVHIPNSREEATAMIRSPFYDDLPRLEQMLYETANEISSKVGLLCLSFRHDSLPMWAHYAANATGLLLEFRNLDRVFTGDETGVLGQPLAVRYERGLTGITFDPKSHEALFFSKFEDWSYEKEVRIVLPLKACRRSSKDEKTIFLHDVNINPVSRIILGWNMPPETSKAVRETVNEMAPNVSVVQASVERGHVTVDGRE